MDFWICFRIVVGANLGLSFEYFNWIGSFSPDFKRYIRVKVGGSLRPYHGNQCKENPLVDSDFLCDTNGFRHRLCWTNCLYWTGNSTYLQNCL